MWSNSDCPVMQNIVILCWLMIGTTAAASSEVQPITSARLGVEANIWFTAGMASAGSPLVSTLLQVKVCPSTPPAALGPTYLASCYGATSAINAAGGVLGHTFTCKSVDTRGDPADAIPAVNQMFASTPNLALVIGCTSDEAAAVVPIINQHKMTMFCMTGQSEF